MFVLKGCSFGYHAGGWGKPPVDEFGRPLYGDVFGSTSADLRVKFMSHYLRYSNNILFICSMETDDLLYLSFFGES